MSIEKHDLYHAFPVHGEVISELNHKEPTPE